MSRKHFSKEADTTQKLRRCTKNSAPHWQRQQLRQSLWRGLLITLAALEEAVCAALEIPA